MPLTVGGGIRTTDDMHALLHAGADKISINSSAIATPELISAGAERFGSQCTGKHRCQEDVTGPVEVWQGAATSHSTGGGQSGPAYRRDVRSTTPTAPRPVTIRHHAPHREAVECRSASGQGSWAHGGGVDQQQRTPSSASIFHFGDTPSVIKTISFRAWGSPCGCRNAWTGRPKRRLRDQIEPHG
jgi:hypothetical protein